MANKVFFFKISNVIIIMDLAVIILYKRKQHMGGLYSQDAWID